MHPCWSDQSHFATVPSGPPSSSLAVASQLSPTFSSSILLPFTILLPPLHPSFSLSCHNVPQSGVRLTHHAYPYPNAYGTLLPMRSAPRDPFIKRVLIIEDDRDTLEIVRYTLANTRFHANPPF